MVVGVVAVVVLHYDPFPEKENMNRLSRLDLIGQGRAVTSRAFLAQPATPRIS